MSVRDSELDLLSSSDDASDEEKLRARIRRKLKKMDKDKMLELSDKLKKKFAAESEQGIIDKKSKSNFKRANKNRPREVSSKRKPDFVVAKTQKPRDPRFDPLSGEFDKSEFKSNYGFVSEIWKREIKQLNEALKTCKNPAEKKKMQLVLQRLENKVRESEKEKQERQEKVEEKQQRREQIRQGQKPFYKKKSEKKLENLVKQYEDLRQGNKLEKHIKKRSKKLAVKERRRVFE